MEKKSILEMAQGAIMEQFDVEVTKAIDNILDVNTPANKKRSIIITVDLVPSSDRAQIFINATAKSKLQPNNEIQTSLCVGVDQNGEIQAVENTPQIPGQMSMDGQEQGEPKFLKLVVGGK